MTVRTPIVLVGREHVPLSEDDTLSVPVPLSGSEDNLLSNTANGLMAELHVDPTGSIQLTGKGTSAKPLTGGLKVDPDASNILTDSSAGVKAAIVLGKSDSGWSSGAGTEDDPLLVGALVASDTGQRIEVLEGKGLFVAPEPISAVEGNTLERKQDGLYAAGGTGGLAAVTTNDSLVGDGTSGTPLGVQLSSVPMNQVVMVAAGEAETGGPGLYSHPVHVQLSLSDHSLRGGPATNPISPNVGSSELSVNISTRSGNALTLDSGDYTGLFVSSDITLSAQKSNILVKAADGYFVDGTHRIIPKFYATTVYPLIDADQTTTYPDGSIRSEVTWSGVNPPAVNGVSAYTLERVQSSVRLMDASGNPVRLQLELVRVSGANWKLVALMSARPVSAYYISNNNEYPGNGNTLSNFPVSVTMLYGYNPAQLNLT